MESMNGDVILAVDEADVKARNGQTKNNQASDKSMMENWVWQEPAHSGGRGSRKGDHNPSWTTGLARDVEMLG